MTTSTAQRRGIRERTIKAGIAGMAAGIAAAFLALIFYAVMLATADGLREMIRTAASLGNPALAIAAAGLVLATISACATALAFVPEIRREIDAMCVRN
ncbi:MULTISPECIES: hypothetical protein [Rhodococcus]|jgi:hypothetical protein|uniref:hypothetical protein n=1 Tax=Rhodococcus TaxID=1827 RepID=UPI000642776E|nr:hypothetical protein [Rhodococcus qingshengii]KLN71640.1 hypothetical protein ABM90_10815 [Rhodococcus erythropolis]KSU66277.1 hypothetical protein AS032_32185 [Rhodococcus qingshengii]NHP18407.1 hypothetical protein [Rhodococcus sp. IC4_135]